MQKNWYIIYTKPKCEKKVASLLTKKKIENFFPLNWREIISLRKRKVCQAPLFESYVFAHMGKSEIDKIKSIDSVVNLLYWKGSPALINKDEIEMIKEFVTDYQDIRVEKTAVNVKEMPRLIDDSKYSFNGNVLIIKNTMAKVNLPSLGFTLTAKVEQMDSLHSTAAFAKQNSLLQS